MSTSPAYRDATEDRALIGLPRAIYDRLYYHQLDFVQFRPVKQAYLAHHFEVDERTIRRALATLLEHRYLERGPVDVTEARTYRLVHSRRVEGAA